MLKPITQAGQELIKITAFFAIITAILFSQGCHRNYTKAPAGENHQELKSDEQSLTDIDGNTYPILRIGEQLWMGSNLRVSHYQNGEAIPANSGTSSLQESESGACLSYNNDQSHDETYGKLYNFKAVQEGNLCPEGWHVPTNDDWQQLISSIEEDEKLISTFNIQKGGFFNPQDISPFSDAGKAANWWSSSSVGRNTAAAYNFQSNASSIDRSGANEELFYSVRCIKN